METNVDCVKLVIITESISHEIIIHLYFSYTMWKSVPFRYVQLHAIGRGFLPDSFWLSCFSCNCPTPPAITSFRLNIHAQVLPTAPVSESKFPYWTLLSPISPSASTKSYYTTPKEAEQGGVSLPLESLENLTPLHCHCLWHCLFRTLFSHWLYWDQILNTHLASFILCFFRWLSVAMFILFILLLLSVLLPERL